MPRPGVTPAFCLGLQSPLSPPSLSARVALMPSGCPEAVVAMVPSARRLSGHFGACLPTWGCRERGSWAKCPPGLTVLGEWLSKASHIHTI